MRILLVLSLLAIASPAAAQSTPPSPCVPSSHDRAGRPNPITPDSLDVGQSPAGGRRGSGRDAATEPARSPGAAHRSADVRVADDVPSDLGTAPGVWVGCGIRGNGGWPAVHRVPSQLPAPPVRAWWVGRLDHRGVPGGANSRAGGDRDSRQGRRGLRVDTVSVEPVDLLAIGPHPDDIEIGIGGIVAKHAPPLVSADHSSSPPPAGRRVSTITWCPPARSALVNARPRNPLPPLITMRICRCRCPVVVPVV